VYQFQRRTTYSGHLSLVLVRRLCGKSTDDAT
jgi:hypothetical protein